MVWLLLGYQKLKQCGLTCKHLHLHQSVSSNPEGNAILCRACCITSGVYRGKLWSQLSLYEPNNWRSVGDTLSRLILCGSALIITSVEDKSQTIQARLRQSNGNVLNMFLRVKLKKQEIAAKTGWSKTEYCKDYNTNHLPRGAISKLRNLITNFDKLSLDPSLLRNYQSMSFEFSG